MFSLNRPIDYGTRGNGFQGRLFSAVVLVALMVLLEWAKFFLNVIREFGFIIGKIY